MLSRSQTAAALAGVLILVVFVTYNSSLQGQTPYPNHALRNDEDLNELAEHLADKLEQNQRQRGLSNGALQRAQQQRPCVIASSPNAALDRVVAPWKGAKTSEANLRKYFKEASRNLTIWKRSSFRKSAIMETANIRDPGLLVTPDMYDVGPEIISCPPGTSLRLIGVEPSDGGKWVCGVESLKAPCVVFSLGSNGNYYFEDSILELTPCDIFTYDCTMADRGGGEVRHPTRHKYFLKCIGGKDKAESDPAFVTLAGAMSLAQVSHVDILKIDIEGFEFDIMSTWGTVEETMDTSYLPGQILMEMHIEDFYFGTPYFKSEDKSTLLMPKLDRMSVVQLAYFYSHLADLGYAIAHLEKNPGCMHCAEIVLLKVMEFPTSF